MLNLMIHIKKFIPGNKMYIYSGPDDFTMWIIGLVTSTSELIIGSSKAISTGVCQYS